MGALLQNTIFGRNKNVFVSTWRTSNVSTGSSTSTQIKLPLVSTGTYNFTVDWGDGTSNKITTWNQTQVTHTYTVAGDYIIKINGTCTGWQFNNTGDRLKILSIQSWGKLRLGNTGNYFWGCANLNLSSVSDTLDLSGTTNMNLMFSGCTSLTTVNRIVEWNTGTVTRMQSSFSSCSNFNQDLGGLNVSNIDDFGSMFSSATSFNNGGSDSINNWTFKTTTTILMNNMFTSAISFNQPIGNWNTSRVTTMNAMFSGASAFNQNISSWNVSNVTNMNIMFGNALAFNQNIGSWNVTSCTNFGSMFNGASTFNNGGSNTINNWVINTTSNVLMNSMFNAATLFNQPIGNWNVSKVTTFQQMFLNAVSFNNGGSSDINNWTLNTTSSVNLSQMFQNAPAFNQNIGSWNTSNVTTFQQMFQQATSFNNGGSNTINNWNTSSSTTMTAMFKSASAFNQPLNSWNTSNVTHTLEMFNGASLFNQNIGAWNVSNVINFGSMFSSTSAFNNGGSSDINNWTLNTLNPIKMDFMFNNAFAFNQPIGNWNTAFVSSMNGMFAFAIFNQNIGGWNVSNVTNFQDMFISATRFNQNISSWNVSSATNMSQMFRRALSFNQNIGSWNISNVTNLTNFMWGISSAGFSAENLDAIYNGWSSLAIKPNISINFGTAKYTSASSTGRDLLTGSPNNWVITDGGVSP
ncbi:BspA family leucine-rich repeat surface protein [Flavobacterium anhuiense]|uniref:BspA family leucine-rich repeat surface protein n=1 Tax=Flavobacterium anhuiense TaxID=459526 RepID=UPI0034D960D7